MSRREKLDALLGYARSEIIEFQAGNIHSLSTYKELAEKFGYGRWQSISSALSEAGISKIRNQIREENIEANLNRIFSPSEDLAWMLGFLSGGGYVDPRTKKGEISFLSPNEHLREKFLQVGERVFEQDASDYSKHRLSLRSYRQITFYNTKIARRIGDVRREQWADTISEQHSWIFEDASYIWSFLEGFFEPHSTVNIPPKAKMIRFNTIYPNAARVLSDMLLQVGIERPVPSPDKTERWGISGVAIYNFKDLQTFSNQVRSIDPIVEEKLDFFRRADVPAEKRRPISIGELITSWQNLEQFLGHVPTASEISYWEKQGIIRFSPAVYNYYFGGGLNYYDFVETTQNIKIQIGAEEGKSESEVLAELAKDRRVYHPNEKLTNEEILAGYRAVRQRIRAEGKKFPTALDFEAAKKEKLIKFSATAVSYRFGGRSFDRAREYFEILIGQEEGFNQNDVIAALAADPRLDHIHTHYTDQEVIDEFRDLIRAKGRVPKSYEIKEMKKNGETRISLTVYVERFGEGDYKKAVQNLLQILKDRD